MELRGLFNAIFGSKTKTAPANSQMWTTLTGFSDYAWKSWNGDAFESDLVRASVDSIARHAGKLAPVFCGSGNPSMVSRLQKAPNSWQTWYQFLYRLSVVLNMQATAFIVPVYTSTFDVIGISVAIPTDFELIEVAGEAWVRFTFANGNTAADKLSNIGIMTRFQFMSDYFGTNNSALDDTLALIDIQRQGIKAAAKSSTNYRFMAKLNNFTKAEDLTNERRRFSRENLASDVDAGGLLLFPNTYTDVRELTQKQYTAEAEQMRVIQNRVFYYFGTNEKILTNSASPEELESFYEGAIEPFNLQLADVLTRMLFTEVEQSYGNRVQFSSDRLAYMSTSEKINLIQQMSDRGQLTQNEARRILNLPDLVDGNRTTIRGEYRTTEYDEDGFPIDDYEDEEGYEDEGEEENEGEEDVMGMLDDFQQEMDELFGDEE